MSGHGVQQQVNLAFTGIVGFVERGACKGYQVVIQNARNAMMSHVAWLFVVGDCEVWAPGWTPTSGGYSLLDGGDAEVLNCVTSPSLTVKPSFDQHILDLSGGCELSQPEFSKIGQKFLTSVNPDLVSARFLVTSGELHAIADRRYSWRWVGGRSGGSRHVAQVALHRFYIDSLTLELWFRPHRHIKITCKDGQPIWIYIGNTEADANGNPTNGLAQGPAVDRHVQIYYDMASQHFARDLRPLLAREGAAGDLDLIPCGLGLPLPPVTKIGGSNCPPGLWGG